MSYVEQALAGRTVEEIANRYETPLSVSDVRASLDKEVNRIRKATIRGLLKAAQEGDAAAILLLEERLGVRLVGGEVAGSPWEDPEFTLGGNEGGD